MSKELAMFDKGNLPDYVVGGFFGDAPSNIPDKQSIPSLSYTGKVWSVNIDGTKTKLTQRNEDGDEIPQSTMKVVVLDSNLRRGRSYYEGSYDPDNIAPPACWSQDGVKPDDSVDEPMSPTCASCPMSAKGSKVTDSGKATVACSEHRMLAVVPAGKLDFTPMRLKIAITSDWDGQSPEQEAQGWFSYSRYLDYLKSRGVQRTAELVTKIKFDQNVAYPKLFFAADRWFSDEEREQVKSLLGTPAVTSLLDGSWTPAGADGVPVNKAVNKSVGNPPGKAAKPAVKAAVEEAEEEVEEEAAATMILDPADPEPETKPAKKPAKKIAKPETEVSEDVPEDVQNLLDAWN